METKRSDEEAMNAAPVCPLCGAQTTLRTAKRGPNPGSQFWGCVNFSKTRCKGAVNIPSTDDGHAAPKINAASPEAMLLSGTRPVAWQDATLRRQGWRVRHVTLGASLRSLSFDDDRRISSNAWIARQHVQSDLVPDESTVRVVGMMAKLLHRGVEPPLHPVAERSLLRRHGLGDRILPAKIEGDLAPRLRGRTKTRPMSLPPVARAARVDREIAFDSSAESDFAEWFHDVAPLAARWLIPQASFDLLLVAHHEQAVACRRCDFLLTLPGRAPVVIEIDGIQHQTQVLTDTERDALLRGIGIDTIRIPVAELGRQRGLGIDRVRALAGGAPSSSPTDFRWEAIQLHRLVEAVLEAVRHGLLAGSKWSIELHDPTRATHRELAPYLQLLVAVDALWGDGYVAPDEVTIREPDGDGTLYVRQPDGSFAASVADNGPPVDLRVLLQYDRTPVHELPALDDISTIVVRSCAVPVRVADVPVGDAERAAVRSTGAATTGALTSVLEAVFAKSAFRPGQLEAITEILEGRDCAVLLPTGAGKSLVYQMAGLCLPGRTLVVDPIVALIEDQIEGMRSHGIDRVAGITRDSLGKANGSALMAAVADADAYFVLVAPERLQMRSFRTALRELAGTAPVNLAVFDEAHTISEWGHQFRTSYLNIGRVVRETCADPVGAPPPLLALTGTASRSVLRDVLFQLQIEERTVNSIVRPQSFDRAELRYGVVRCDEKNAEASLRGVIKQMPGLFGETSQTFFAANGEDTQAGIVFVPTVDGGHGVVATQKAVAGVVPNSTVFSGRQPKGSPAANWEQTKRANARAFKTDVAPVLVSTNAFGMGIDKPNIRWVVHYGLPSSIESFYQEVGRAGRDRRRAECRLILSQYDEERNRRLLADDLSLDEARAQQQRLPSPARDVVTTALFFHLSSFPGVEDELESLLEVADLLELSDERSTIEVPFGGAQEARERALHRLVMLGCVRDYLVEWGSSSFAVDTAATSPSVVVSHLVSFVARSQPGRLSEIKALVERPYAKLSEAIEWCGRAMVEFVYETIERSRRRSLREMWLAAHESRTSDDLRRRILDFLMEGEISPTLEALVDRRDFQFDDWQAHWANITGSSDAREWRAASGRLLASYPDHPGLLASRGLSEALDPDGEVRELELNLVAALRSASTSYGARATDLDRLLTWLLDSLSRARPAVLAAVASAFVSTGNLSDQLWDWLRNGSLREEPSVAALYLSVALADALDVADLAIDYYEEVR